MRDFIQTSEIDKTTIRDLTVLLHFPHPILTSHQASLDTLRTKLTEEESKSKDLEVRMSILENKNREESLKTDSDETYMRPSDVPRTISKYVLSFPFSFLTFSSKSAKSSAEVSILEFFEDLTANKDLLSLSNKSKNQSLILPNKTQLLKKFH